MIFNKMIIKMIRLSLNNQNKKVNLNKNKKENLVLQVIRIIINSMNSLKRL
jgi:hypothetical protein